MKAGWFFVALLMSFLTSRGVSAAVAPTPQPLPTGGYTWHEYYREVLEFHRKTLIDGYRSSGSRNVKWDAAAEGALDALARSYATGATAGFYAAPFAISMDQVGVAAKKAIDLGCTDPMVMHAMAVGHFGGNRRAEQLACLDKAYKGIQGSTYPPFWTAAVTAMMSTTTGDVELRNDALARGEKALLECASGKFLNSAHRRSTCQTAIDYLKSRATDAQQDAFMRRLDQQKGVDPWILAMLHTKWESIQAWKARGQGYARDVTPEGWQGFRDHQANARRHGEAAHQLHPEYPEAAVLLIDVAMAQSDHDRVVSWFKKAIAAQIDDAPAYSYIYNALLPRWLGSHEEMLQIGMDAARTGRYDTTAPFQFINAINAVARDTDGRGIDSAIWRVPEIRATAQKVLEGYCEQLKGQRPYASYYQTYLAILEYQNHKVNRAFELIKAAGDPVRSDVFRECKVSEAAILDEIRKLTQRPE